MPAKPALPSAVMSIVTPRLEIFYALRALNPLSGNAFGAWRSEMEARLPKSVSVAIASVAPSPFLWPLLADSLRDVVPEVSYEKMIAALGAMPADQFRDSVLAGVFRSSGTAEKLSSGELMLSDAVSLETASREKVLSLLGLYPFEKKHPTVRAFQRLVSDAPAYQSEVVAAIEGFWSAGFSNTWDALEPQMRKSATSMTTRIRKTGFAKFAETHRLPITIHGGAIVASKDGKPISLSPRAAVHLIPSAFNAAGFWAAYESSSGEMRFFIPVFDPELSIEAIPVERANHSAAKPAVIFKALGDTTRYAIATTLARTPMTSVDLAKVFKVSKPTISHHVQQFRAAQLLLEQHTENGVVLSLDRQAVEGASALAAAEMFSTDGPAHVVKRTRKVNKSRRRER